MSIERCNECGKMVDTDFDDMTYDSVNGSVCQVCNESKDCPECGAEPQQIHWVKCKRR